MLSRCRHAHLVPLIAASVDGPVPCLVYPLMASGTLRNHLEDAARRVNLTWRHRLRIAAHVARGLDYLHRAAPSKPAIIHRECVRAAQPAV